MQLVAPTDAMFLAAEARERPMHVGSLQLFRPPPDAGPDHPTRVYRDALAHREVMSRLRRRPRRLLLGLGPWVWEEDTALDLEYHLRHSALPHPGRVRELLALTSRLHGALLDRTRPLWEAHVIEGLQDGRFAVYTKIHHALADGVTAIRLLERGTSHDPDERGMPPAFAPSAGGSARAAAEHGGSSALSWAAGLARGTVGATVESARAAVGASDAAFRALLRSFSDQAAALPYQAPRSMLNGPISGARRFAADSWPLERLEAVGTGLHGTINDVVLAMCAGALRRYLQDLDALPDKPLVAMVPVSLRPRSGEDDEDVAGNAVGVILCNLATHLADPVRRFELITASTREGKLRLEGLTQWGVLLLSALAMAGVGVGTLPLYQLRAFQHPPFNVIISNVPGPREPRYHNGALMEGMYPVSIPFDGQALNVTVSSYAGRMGFGLIGCRRSVPRLQRLLDHLAASLEELEAASG